MWYAIADLCDSAILTNACMMLMRESGGRKCWEVMGNYRVRGGDESES
jgi:hypothetical protein